MFTSKLQYFTKYTRNLQNVEIVATFIDKMTGDGKGRRQFQKELILTLIPSQLQLRCPQRTLPPLLMSNGARNEASGARQMKNVPGAVITSLCLHALLLQRFNVS